MRVADYIADKIEEAGARTAFLITGGMIMHLTDALRDKDYVCCHHEQSAVMAAEAYGRATNKLGAAYVTAGPGALNALNGVVGAYVDSSPLIVVSGQSKVSQLREGPRQFALQGFNTLPIYKNVTKYAVTLTDLSRVRYEVEKCIHYATTPRVGPVWLEVPIDIQGMDFDPSSQEGFVPEGTAEDAYDVDAIVDLIRKSERPCILAGAGVRLSGAVDQLNDLVARRNIPVMTSRLGMDLVDDANPLFVGRPGTYGDRPANFAVQRSDLLVVIGCRLAIGLTGYDYQFFAQNATVVQVDMDQSELDKDTVHLDYKIKADAGLFLSALDGKLGDYRFGGHSWLSRIATWRRKYPVVLPEYKDETEGVNSYLFMDKLSASSAADDVFLCDTGSCFHVFAQAFKVKLGQRHIITGGLSTMGYFPASIGVALAFPGKPVYCITGDGSFQFNLQELQTAVHHNLPIRIIVLNNNGYLLIRHTQINFQGGRLMGTQKDTGVSFPDLEKIAGAYGVGYMRISSFDEIDGKLSALRDVQGPVIVDVITPGLQLLIPRVASKKLEDGTMVSMEYDNMFPFLGQEEYEQA